MSIYKIQKLKIKNSALTWLGLPLIISLALTLSFASPAGAFTGPSAGQQPGSGGGLLFSSSTNIGIGTTNPGVKLEVSGTNDNALRLTTGGIYPFDFSVHTDSKLYIKGASTGNLIFDQYGNLLIPNGVSVATTSTAYPLTVNGNVWSSGSFIGSLSGNLSAANVTGPAAFGSNYGTYNYAMPGALAVGTTTVTGLQANSLFVNGNVGIGTASPGKTLDVMGQIRALTDIESPGAYVNTIYPYSGNAVAIDNNIAGNIAYFNGTNGNVGIGTSTPGYKLDVQGGQINASGGLCIAGTCQTSWSGASQWVTTSTGIYYSSGNVGVGTASPGAALDVAGAEIRLSAANTYNYLTLYGNGGNSTFQFRNNVVAAGTMDAYYNGVSRMVITNTGNVGIGTTNPGGKLDVQGTILYGGGSNIGVLTGDASWAYLYGYPSRGLNFGANNTTGMMVLTTGGNVGIGTTGPATTLDVAGNGMRALSSSWSAPASGAGLELNYRSATDDAHVTSYNRSTATYKDLGIESANLHIYSGGVERVTILSGGNVGIGTTNPTSTLSVAGSLHVISGGGDVSLDSSGNFIIQL